MLALVELRAAFASRAPSCADADRGAQDVDLGPLDDAAHRLASAENRAVFHGWERPGSRASPRRRTHERSRSARTATRYPRHVAKAVETLLRAGIDGPYGAGARARGIHARLETTEHGGYPLLDHLREIIGGPLVWAPGVEGAVVVSQRGGDFLFESGQDLSIGYDAHDADVVELYLEESFSFRVATPEAAVALSP